MKVTTMTDGNAVPELQTLGFSEYEAKAYVALLQGGPLTGYQVAKASGIPRPNVYPLLDRLEQRGALTRVESEGRVRYRALPAAEMLRDLSRNFSSQLERAEGALNRLRQAPAAESVRNIEGYDAVIGAAEGLVGAAKETLLLALWSPESARLGHTVDQAQRRGVKITTLCIEGCADECGGCRGNIHRHPIASGLEVRWLIVARDERELLVGQASPDGRATAVLTRVEAVVAVGTQYVRNTVALAEILRTYGPRLFSIGSGPVASAIQQATAGPAGAWLEVLLKGAIGRTNE
jgi:HTH-type transcriptional regulator, sugar sensing transcriptional regulator